MSFALAEAKLAQSTVFKNNKSQAIRLPKPVAFPDGVKIVDIVKIGRGEANHTGR